LDFGHGSFLPNFDGSALAKGDNGGGTVTVVETGMAGGTVTVAETGMAGGTGILMAVDAAVATATETPAARLEVAQETATVRAAATLTAADVVAGLATVAGTETVVEMPAEAKMVEAATPAIRGMLAAMETAPVMAGATGTVEGGAAAQETGIATAAAKATLTPVVLVAA
jgi:hypothetical protein